MRRFTESTGPIFKRPQIIRLGRLLDMEYKPSEIAEELGVNVSAVYQTYMPAGCPCRRDYKNHIWIHGSSFASWARAINEQNKKTVFHLEEDQAWCLKCNAVVKMEDAHRRTIKKNLIMIFGTCAVCGGKVNKLQSGKIGDDQSG